MRPLRILCFLQPGTVSRALFLDFIDGLTRAGHTCLNLELSSIWKRMEAEPAKRAVIATAATRQVVAAITQHRIDLSISMWSNAISTLAHGSKDGKPATCFELMPPPQAPHPHLQYWLDAPQWAQGGTVRTLLPTGVFKSPCVYNYVNSPHTAEEMTRVLGFRHALGMPYGVNETVFRPPRTDGGEPAAAREFDLCFAIGPGDPPPTELMLRELERDRPDCEAIRSEASWRVAPRLDELAGRAEPGALRDRLRELLAELLQSQLDARHTPVLTRLDAIIARRPELQAAQESLLADPALFIDATALVRSVEHWERAFTFVYLARRFRCLLSGEADLGAWGCPVQSIGFVPHERQSEVYARARMGLSVMRWQDDAGLHPKVLECAASGTVPLVARRAGIDELLKPGDECAVFEGPAEAARQLAEHMKAPARLDEIADAALQRVRREHTWKVRADAIVRRLGVGVED